MLIPSRLIVDVAGLRRDAVRRGGRAGRRHRVHAAAVTDLLGVSVDDSWTMTTDGLAALVDSVGGVQAAVDVDVVTTDAKGNETVVGAGRQPAPEGAGRRRVRDLPRRRRARAGAARALRRRPHRGRGGAAEGPCLARGRAGRARGRVHARRWTPRRWPTGWRCCGSAAADGSLVSDVLPVTEIDTGGAVTSYGLDAGQADAMMRGPLPRVRCSRTRTARACGSWWRTAWGPPGWWRRPGPSWWRPGSGSSTAATPRRSTPTRAVCWCRTAPTRASSGASGSPPPSGCRSRSVRPEDRGQSVADVIVILGLGLQPP